MYKKYVKIVGLFQLESSFEFQIGGRPPIYTHPYLMHEVKRILGAALMYIKLFCVTIRYTNFNEQGVS